MGSLSPGLVLSQACFPRGAAAAVEEWPSPALSPSSPLGGRLPCSGWRRLLQSGSWEKDWVEQSLSQDGDPKNQREVLLSSVPRVRDCYGSKAPLRWRGVAAKADEVPSFCTASPWSGFSTSLSQFFALSSNSGLVEGRGPHTQLQGPHLTKCQKHQLGAMRGGSLEGRRQENSLPLVPSGHLHQGRVSRRRTPEKAAMSGRGWSVSKIVGELAQSALGDPEGPLGGGGLSAGLWGMNRSSAVQAHGFTVLRCCRGKAWNSSRVNLKLKESIFTTSGRVFVCLDVRQGTEMQSVSPSSCWQFGSSPAFAWFLCPHSCVPTECPAVSG